jgi:hypothetical protein
VSTGGVESLTVSKAVSGADDEMPSFTTRDTIVDPNGSVTIGGALVGSSKLRLMLVVHWPMAFRAWRPRRLGSTPCT